MQELKFKKDADNLYEAHGLTNERGDELCYEMRLIMHSLHTPTRELGPKIIDDMDVLIPFAALARTEMELSYLSFIAGRRTSEMKFDSR